MNIAVYPGTFDPCTNGHLSIIRRTAAVFDRVYVAILNNSGKNPLFSLEERIEYLKRITADIPNVEVECFSGLLIDYVHQKNAQVIIRGLRAVSDFEYEFQMALTNRKLAPDVETLFMATEARYSYLSSSIVKEVAALGGCLDDLVPECIRADIEEKINKMGEL
ncbi:MAG: pantetheine-phosphate adenylyltransferase [Clostridia bacterium]|nr:pantetheine-phosphate adenylyltransferase [Clostridia bacterium]